MIQVLFCEVFEHMTMSRGKRFCVVTFGPGMPNEVMLAIDAGGTLRGYHDQRMAMDAMDDWVSGKMLAAIE